MNTVGQVADIAHVSVRTLHHYDEIGLLEPSGYSDGGYRLYDDEDLERLQEILFFKAAGLELSQIRELLASPDYERRAALFAHRELLEGRLTHLHATISAVDRALRASTEGIPMSHEEMFEVFGDFDPAEHEAEAKERWGDSDAYRESSRRTADYTTEDWKRFKDESEEITLAIAVLIDEDVPADDPRAMDAVELARKQIDQWFYPCSRAMHAELGRMYVVDPRFNATYEKIRVGMAQYMCDATAANLARETGDGGS